MEHARGVTRATKHFGFGTGVRFRASARDAMIYISDDPAPWDEDLEAEFPLGDGVADTSATVQCPYCGEAVDVALDPGSGTRQGYVEDCQVCCRPWHVTVVYGADGAAEVWAEPAD